MTDPAVLVSACLLGVECNHRGAGERSAPVLDALQGCTVVPVCPEVEGGLGVPRPRAEVAGGDGTAVLDTGPGGGAAVCTGDGTDVTDAYLRGARAALAIAEASTVSLAILKSRSPSCGCSGIYDGSHTRTVRPGGVGVTAALLMRHGIPVVDEAAGPAAIRLLLHSGDGHDDGGEDAHTRPAG